MDMKTDPISAGERLIPLAALRPSPRNARKTGGASVKQLARSISRVGLLQNLTVTESGDGEHYAVEAGKRRLKALQLLVRRRKLSATHEVRCLVVPDSAALTASLTENTQREAMHPADEFEAFRALVEEGRPIEDIAADFGVTPLAVQRRLKLANVSPRLLADYRKELVTLEQLMALAVTDDHAAQEAAFYQAPEWQRDPQTLREHLTCEDVDAARDAVARFVGFDAYVEAGGGYRRDLFADAGQGVYLTDRALLDRLASIKLKPIAAEIEAEGWVWIEVVPRATPSELYAFQRLPSRRRKPTVKEARQIAKLHKRIEQIAERLNAEDGIEDAEARALDEEREQLDAELAAIQQSLVIYSQKAKANAGVVLTVEGQGRTAVHRGLLREADAKKAQAAENGGDGEAVRTDDPKPNAEGNPSVSEKLARQLSAHRTAALQAELSRQPGVALIAVVQRLALQTLYEADAVAAPLKIDARPQTPLERHAPDFARWPAGAVLAEARHAWQDRLPDEPERLFGALRELEQDQLLSLLALCAACCIDAVSPRETDTMANPLAEALDLDMTQWWKAKADGYFGQLPKARIFEAIKDFAPEYVNQLKLYKRPELAARAEELAAGRNWLPAMLRRAA